MSIETPIQYPAGTLDNVLLENGYREFDSPFGRARQYINSTELDMALCAAVIQKPARLNAKEIVYLRSRAEWRQQDLAERLHVHIQTVSLWERAVHRIPAASDLLLRARFLDEAPRNRRPKLALRKMWGHFDKLVKAILDFDYLGRFEKSWSFSYRQQASSFVVHETSSADPQFAHAAAVIASGVTWVNDATLQLAVRSLGVQQVEELWRSVQAPENAIYSLTASSSSTASGEEDILQMFLSRQPSHSIVVGARDFGSSKVK